MLATQRRTLWPRIRCNLLLRVRDLGEASNYFNRFKPAGVGVQAVTKLGGAIQAAKIATRESSAHEPSSRQPGGVSRAGPKAFDCVENVEGQD